MITSELKKQIGCLVAGCGLLVSFSASSFAQLEKPSEQQRTESKEKPGRGASRSKDHGHPPDQATGRQPNSVDPNSVNPQGGGGGGWKAPVIIGGGAAAAILITEFMHHKTPEQKLRDKGPQLESEINMSGFAVKGFVKGGWPVVLDYQLPPGGEVVLTVAAEGAVTQEYHLDASDQRRQEIVSLPQDFGEKPRAGLYSIRAQSKGTAQPQPVYLRVYGLGAGEEAVGSVAIDELSFGPQKIRKKDDASFGFHSHSEFNRTMAEFMRSGLSNGQLINNLDGEKEVKQLVTENKRIEDKWNTKKARSGDHLLQVRAWRFSGSDWVIAWSADLVEVQE